MARGKTPDPDEPGDDERDFMDFEANHETVRKILGLLKPASIHEAMLTLLNACDTLAKIAPGNWDDKKVKQVLDDI
jgi:hypothetical protein